MKIKITLLFLSLFIISCVVLAVRFGNDPDNLDLPDLGPAPELENQIWINTDQPLRLADLRGKVVLLEMWTFG